MKPEADQSETIRFLSQPQSYGGAAEVQTIRTHASMVFLVGDRAYKLKFDPSCSLFFIDSSLERPRKKNHKTSSAPCTQLGFPGHNNT
jgi:aminoglycoside phosphotransferase family enzyme